MSTDPHEATLLGLIDRVLAGDMPFDEYERSYQDYYIDIPDGELPEWPRREFFAKAHELLDWTAEQPDDESRRYGWQDRAEYLEWLRSARAAWARDHAVK